MKYVESSECLTKLPSLPEGLPIKLVPQRLRASSRGH